MKIHSTGFNSFFPKINDIRRKLFEFEEELNEYFLTPFNLIPVPDDAPEEIPRIHAQSEFGHSDLSVALDRLTFGSKYDERFNDDWAKCVSYLNERALPIINIVQRLVDNRFLYSGLTTEITFENLEIDPIRHFQEKFIKVNTQSDPFDINFRFTYVVDEKYYLNVALSNQRIFTGNNPMVAVPAYLEQVGTGIALQLDVNDRHGFNYIQGYSSTSDDAKRIIEITSEFINGKMMKIINEGEFEL